MSKANATPEPHNTGSGMGAIVAVSPVESLNPPSAPASAPKSIVEPLVTAAKTSNGTGNQGQSPILDAHVPRRIAAARVGNQGQSPILDAHVPRRIAAARVELGQDGERDNGRR
jgi:hypothetical protein